MVANKLKELDIALTFRIYTFSNKLTHRDRVTQQLLNNLEFLLLTKSQLEAVLKFLKETMLKVSSVLEVTIKESIRMGRCNSLIILYRPTSSHLTLDQVEELVSTLVAV